MLTCGVAANSLVDVRGLSLIDHKILGNRVCVVVEIGAKAPNMLVPSTGARVSRCGGV